MYAHYGNSDFDRRVCKSEKHLPQYELLGKRGHSMGGETIRMLAQLLENGDADETKRKCDDTEKMWDKKSPLLGVYTNHSEMDELMMLMKQIRQLSTDKDYDELIEKCRESIYRFEHIAETETPLFGNVF